MNIKNFKVGQTVYVELTGNASRRKTADECIEEWEITSVGRKYIKAGRCSCGSTFGNRVWNETIFEYRESYGRFVQKTDCCVNYILYETRQEIEDEHERERLRINICNMLSDYRTGKKISLEQLRKIKSILDEEKNNDS